MYKKIISSLLYIPESHCIDKETSVKQIGSNILNYHCFQSIQGANNYFYYKKKRFPTKVIKMAWNSDFFLKYGKCFFSALPVLSVFRIGI